MKCKNIVARLDTELPGISLSREIDASPDMPGSGERVSNPAELLLELGLGEHERRRPAVRAMMRVGDEMAAVEERPDLFGGQLVAGLHGRLARDHVEELG